MKPGFSAVWMLASAAWGLALGYCELLFGTELVDYLHTLDAKAAFGNEYVKDPVFESQSAVAGVVALGLAVAMVAFVWLTKPDGRRMLQLIPGGILAGLGLLGWFGYWFLMSVLPMKGVA